MIDSSRRTVLTTGAAVAATAAVSPAFAQAPQGGAAQGLPAGAKSGFYEKGNIRIRYAEIGSGFPLLALPGGGLNSRIAAALLSQPVGHRPEKPDVMYDLSRDVWGKNFRERRPDVSEGTIEKYLHNLYRVQPDFVYSVTRDFAKSCQTPMLVLPDDVPAHPLTVSIAIASLAPNAEITVFPWKDQPELKARTINRARMFLKRHVPA